MLRLTAFSVLILSAHCGNLPTVLTPFTLTPSVEILKSPVTKVETISITPTYTKTISPAVALTTPVVQKIDSYSSGDSSSSEIRDLLRSLLTEIRGKSTLSSPLASYSAPEVSEDSYSSPPRNTVTNYNAPVYPDSKKPEKIIYVQEKQVAPIVTVEPAPVAVKEVVKTVYQPVYVPVQYPSTEYLTVAQQTAPVAIPTTIKTGASAVAYSTLHGSPAYKIQQQPVQYIQQVQAQPVAYASATLVSDASAAAVVYKK